jgi:hypothetical protein
MYRALDEHQSALQEQEVDYYEKCAKIQEAQAERLHRSLRQPASLPRAVPMRL